MSCALHCRGEVKLPSPAKVNLFFRILSKRPDGYHEIVSLYQAISLHDELLLALSQRDQFECRGADLLWNETNLVYKALHVFRNKTGWNAPVRIHLTKSIPMQSGLGGGSGNAATMLWGLSQLSGLNISDEELALWAGEFSSDAPFFFSTGSALCSGRGEKVENLPDLPPQQFWLAKPKGGLSTPAVYGACAPHLLEQRNPYEYLLKAQRGECAFFNDLEQPAFKLMPSLKELQENLSSIGFNPVAMTGSGTAMICFPQDSSKQYRDEIDGVQFYPVRYVSRRKGFWYEFPSVCYNP